MRRQRPVPHRQHGAIAIMAGLLIVVLIGFGGLAIDLGRLYIVKTELQNAADAAALGAAKDLNNTAAGVTAAATAGIAIAAGNKYNFSTGVTLRDRCNATSAASRARSFTNSSSRA